MGNVSDIGNLRDFHGGIVNGSLVGVDFIGSWQQWSTLHYQNESVGVWEQLGYYSHKTIDNGTIVYKNGTYVYYWLETKPGYYYNVTQGRGLYYSKWPYTSTTTTSTPVSFKGPWWIPVGDGGYYSWTNPFPGQSYSTSGAATFSVDGSWNVEHGYWA